MRQNYKEKYHNTTTHNVKLRVLEELKQKRTVHVSVSASCWISSKNGNTAACTDTRNTRCNILLCCSKILHTTSCLHQACIANCSLHQVNSLWGSACCAESSTCLHKFSTCERAQDATVDNLFLSQQTHF